ncbi:hypothetical protein B0181_02290 [Moraxella caviae]|uniref:Sec-independent protein translocase protein TatB n=1 Tax=Moraxella caviae TaxID=34060 RepID=A0A1T0A826_9GAMM|nr:twin-arginine translocase TatA/TatE family subunit [Moraxella caviae]OOR91882.1 hypothetical protein B0181_02290 [Moraxella caviae]STZ09733.1 Sec-independent protein translocase protein TatB [Moraxella caviae]VEW11228.1 Sec-independent protein translocase protein TatB [Moraxella caviae]
MFNLGLFELTLFGVIALIVLGPEKLPEFARTLGRWYGLFRRTTSRLQNDLMSELELIEAQAQLKSEIAKIRESEAAMRAQMDAMQRSLNAQHAKTAPAAPSQTVSQTASQVANQLANPAVNQVAQTANEPQQNHAEHTLETALNLPLTNRWFLLGEYDKRRRLPPAPFLPNYQADPLLHQMQSY